MPMFLLILTIINVCGIYQYGWWSILGAPHKQQMLVDFVCPFGAFLSRIVFKFDVNTNKFAYIYGAILQIFIGIIVFTFWR